MKMRLGACSAILFFLAIAGCVRREGRNVDCKWPGELQRRSSDAKHLSADAEFAEDLAIRYADAHYGLRTPGYVSLEAYAGARDTCMALLFEQIAKEHGVRVGLVSDALGRNRGRIDLAINLPFMLLYCFAAIAVGCWLWRTYSPAAHGWLPVIAMALFLSFAMAAGGTMLGEVSSGIVESYRVGNGHSSYRVQRLWWVRHRTVLFTGATAVFWLAVIATAHQTKQSNFGWPNATGRR